MSRIALLDDHPIVRRGFKQLIESVPAHTVVVEHASGAALLDDPALADCDLLVLDLSLPDMDGFELAEVMRSILPFYTALIVALLLVTYVPAFSLTLPRLLGH